MEYYLKVLREIPCLVVVEPDLLMYLMDGSEDNLVSQNKLYRDNFLFRVMKIIKFVLFSVTNYLEWFVFFK